MPTIKEQTIGKVLTLFISKKENSNRVSKDILHLDTAGVKKDKFYNKEINRSVLISSLKSYDLAKEEDIDLDYGALGENILIDYNLYDLPTGSKIQIGEVILEVTQHCTLCKSLSKVDNKLPKILKDDRGIFTKVINSGFISKNDTVKLLD